MAQWLADHIIELIGAFVFVTGAWYAFGGRLSKSESDIALGKEGVAKLEKVLTEHRGFIDGHYRAISNIDKAVAAFGAQLTAHIADDQRQLTEIKEIQRESRDDFRAMRKEILEAIAELRSDHK